MTKTKRLQGECQQCGSPMEFPAESIGLMARCPHCAKDTELVLAAPPYEPTVPRRVVVWTVATVLLLIAALIALLTGLKQMERRAAEERQKAAPPAHGETSAPAKGARTPENR